MARGVMPRRPAKSGRHEGATAKPRPVKSLEGAKGLRRPTRPSTMGPKNANAAVAPSSPPSKAGKATVPSVAKTKSYKSVAPNRVSEILKRLDQLYPDVTCALTHRDPWELLVATILSAQSTDVRVNMVTPELFKKYPTVQDFARLDPQQVEPDVRSTGFFRNKSKSVVGAARKI